MREVKIAMKFSWLVVLALACPLARSAQPTVQLSNVRDFSHLQVIEVANGPNRIDIDGDGRKDLVFSAHRSNFNAHDFEHLTFYMQDHAGAVEARATSPEKPLWNVVPFFTSKGPEFVAFDTIEGADCWLRDMVLLRDSGGSVTAVVADREMGTSYAAKAHMLLSVYQLMHNPEGLVGSPPVYFQRIDHFSSKNPYCDADHAIAAELGVKFPHPLDDNGIDH
ncbi:MAG TPA: hypothetical protein VN043_11755 [Rhodanobacter sp.]|nr:hypothetical protein [Rhodanobacter sp.]